MATTCSPKDTTAANIKWSSSNAQPAALYILRTRNTNELCARKGGDIFPDLPLAHPSSGPNSTHEPEGYGRRFSYVHITEHLEGCTQQNISKDANRAPRRIHTTKHLEGCEQKHLEGCTSQNITKVKLSHQNIHDYNESRPD